MILEEIPRRSKRGFRMVNNSTRTYLSLLLSVICIRSTTSGKRPSDDFFEVIEKLGKIDNIGRAERVAEHLYHTLLETGSIEEFVTRAKNIVQERQHN